MGASGSSVLPLKLGRRERCAPRGSAPGRRVPPRLCGAELATQNGRRRPPGRPGEADNGRQDPRGAELEGASGSWARARSPAAQTGIKRRLQRNRDAEKQPRRRPDAGPDSGERKQPRGEGGGCRGSAGGRLWPSAARRRNGKRTHFTPRDKRAPTRSPPQAWETGSQAPSDPQSIPAGRPERGMLGKPRGGQRVAASPPGRGRAGESRPAPLSAQNETQTPENLSRKKFKNPDRKSVV